MPPFTLLLKYGQRNRSMDTTVTGRFYRLVKPEAAAPNVEKILRDLGALELKAREIDVGDGVRIRLERLEEDANFLGGQFCRIQSANLPPTADDDGLEPTVLGAGKKGLGHVAAFRFHIPTQIMLVQVNQQSATTNRISLYLSLAVNKPVYQLDPVVRADVFKRMKKAEIKAFSVRVAEPQNLEALDDPTVSAFKGARTAAKAFNAREVEIIIHAGTKKKKEKNRPHLFQKPVRDALARFARVKNEDAVKGLKAQIIDPGGNQTEWIDLLEQQIKETAKLDLDAVDPETNYQRRKTFLVNTFNANIESLKELYGPNGGN